MDLQSNGHKARHSISPLLKDTHPLRHGHIETANRRGIQFSGSRVIEDDEEEYERRREEELKKQIRSKEQEIQNLAKASDFLRSKLDSQINTSQKLQESEQQRYASFGRQVPERDRSTFQQREPQPPPSHVREHIANLQSDNASLMRRLNLVLQELERVNREKEDIQLRLQQFAKETMNMQRMLNGEDNVDKVNKYMQEDFMYEKDKNLKLKEQIKDYDDYKNELIRDLRKVEDSADHQASQGQKQASELQKKISQISDIEKEVYYTQEKIKQNLICIEQARREQVLDQEDKMELQRVLDQLLGERNELMSKLDSLTDKYDDCVREISRDRKDMERHNKQHSKLVTAKVMFSELEMCLKSRLAMGFREIKGFCEFDNKCHSKLQSFAKVLDQIGRQMYYVLSNQHLYQAIKGIETMVLGCPQAYGVSYELKNNALQKMWFIKKKDSEAEAKRSFQIWKETLQSFKNRNLRVQKLIYNLYFRKLHIAFGQWQDHSKNLDLQVRLNLLSKKFTQKQYLGLLFSNFKLQSFEMKRIRLNTLFHCMKDWRDSINYSKFLRQSKLVSLNFLRENNTSILKQCFDSLRQNKEDEKFRKTDHELNQIERPLMEQLDSSIADKQDERKVKLERRAGECLVQLTNKSMNSYFSKWKQIYVDFKQAPDAKIKGRLIKIYYDKIRIAFNRWKVQGNQIKLQNNEMVVFEQQEMQRDLTNEVISLQKEIKSKEGMKDESKKKSINRCVRSMQLRFIKQAIDRWRDKINQENVKEDGADILMKRIRSRFLRQAFDLYLAGSKYRRKVEIDEERCKYYNKTREERLKKLVFENWRIFKDNFSKSKDYWSRIYMKMDRILTQRGFKRWREGSQITNEQELQQEEASVIDQITELNQEIGSVTAVEEQQALQIKHMKQSMTQQAQRVLSNAFAKYYYIGETRGFEKWKEYVQFQKRRERLLKRIAEHWKRYQFNYVKNCLQNWIIFANINEKKELIKKEDARIKDAKFVYENSRKNLSSAQNSLSEELQIIKNQQEMYNQRLQKCISIIVNKVDKNDYVCKKRYILTQWRAYVQREVFFIKCIKNVISKSLWTQGFKQIREYSRRDRLQQNLEEVMNKFRVKFYKRTCGNAFSVWRSGGFQMISQTIEETIAATQQKIQSHQERVNKRKSRNADRMLKLLAGQNLKNLFYGWKNVSSHYKKQSTQAAQYWANINSMRKAFAIRKWNGRKQATFRARERVAKLKLKFQRMRLLFTFKALQGQFFRSRDLMTTISNFARVLDHQVLKNGYNAIVSYSRAKEYVHYKQKEHSSSEIFGALQRIVKRKKHQYMNDLKYRTVHRYKQTRYKTLTIMLNASNKLRYHFLNWKKNSEKIQLAMDMMEEGPVREQIFNEAIKLKNCQKFMADEGYHEGDIKNALKIGEEKQKGIMVKAIRRLQHNNPSLYVKPKYFDKWRQYIHQRKQFKYWLNYVANRSQYIKSDIAVAFDRWKQKGSLQRDYLQRLAKRELEAKILTNSHHLSESADLVQYREVELNHLSDQRDELVENYIKGQKLALALWKNNRKRSMHKAMSRWSEVVANIKNFIANEQLRKNVALIAALKEKIRCTEKENDDLSNENEELRQFSLDGYEIAKNVQSLSLEREKLSVDLADKAQTIRKLLDENEKLNRKLKNAQEEAQTLIKSSGNKYSGKQNKQFQSPMIRSNVY